MSTQITTAELLKGDISAHTPMMAQYLGVTFYSNAGEAFEAILLAPVPSWSPSRVRQMQTQSGAHPRSATRSGEVDLALPHALAGCPTRNA